MRTRTLRLVVALTLALGVMLGQSSPAAAYVENFAFFSADIIDTDGDRKHDLSVCFGDNTSQGVYIGRAALLDRLELHFGYMGVGDDSVNGRAYQAGFVSSGVCNNDGSSIHIHYWNGPAGEVGMAKREGGNGLSPNIRECHIYLNSDFSFSWETPTESTKVDGAAAVTHELLHCWGLNHSNVGAALMHVPGMNVNCSLLGHTMYPTSDDIAGAESIYDGDTYYSIFQTPLLWPSNWGAPSTQCAS